MSLYNILSAVTPTAIVDSTDASPINIQATAHGFSTGDQVVVVSHETNTNANGLWTVTKVDANNFTLDDSTATGGGAGGATGFVYAAPKIISVADFRHLFLTIGSTGTATATVKIVGAMTEIGSAPDFEASASLTNPWDYIRIIDKQNSTGADGDTGISWAAADDVRQFEVNTNILSFISIRITAWTQGAITINAKCIQDV